MHRNLPDLSVLSFAHTVAPIGAPKRKRGRDPEDNLDSEEEEKEHAAWRARLLPCHEELVYNDGEMLNLDESSRVQGKDSLFSRVAREGLPYGEVLTTIEQLTSMAGVAYVQTEHVLQELYSNRQPTQPPKRQQAAELAYVEAFGKDEKPQYRLVTVERQATLSHTVTHSMIWALNVADKADPKVDDFCFTNGFIWTNPAPDWAYKSDKRQRSIRVRVDIPPATQVIIDRAPFAEKLCLFDTERVSIFPDVLLAPAKFRVTSVVHYRSDAKDYKTSKDEPGRIYTYVTPSRSLGSTSDEDYAARRVFDSNGEFMDVGMELVQQVKLPPVGSVFLT